MFFSPIIINLTLIIVYLFTTSRSNSNFISIILLGRYKSLQTGIPKMWVRILEIFTEPFTFLGLEKTKFPFITFFAHEFFEMRIRDFGLFGLVSAPCHQIELRFSGTSEHQIFSFRRSGFAGLGIREIGIGGSAQTVLSDQRTSLRSVIWIWIFLFQNLVKFLFIIIFYYLIHSLLISSFISTITIYLVQLISDQRQLFIGKCVCLSVCYWLCKQLRTSMGISKLNCVMSKIVFLLQWRKRFVPPNWQA